MSHLSKKQQIVAILLLALLLRLLLLTVATDNIDVQNYAKVAGIVTEHGIRALYVETPSIYPYPPIWVRAEVLAAVLAQGLGGSYSFFVRLPIVLADLFIVGILLAWKARAPEAGRFLPAFFYAINPVALIVTCLHGQFDAIPIAFLLLALYLLATNRRVTYSGLALAFAIATKSFPILFLPIFVAAKAGMRERIKLICMAVLPVLLLLLPFLLLSPAALLRELFGYRGAALLGFMVPVRTLYVPLAGSSIPIETTTQLLRFSTYLFLMLYLAYMALLWRRGPVLLRDTITIFALFYTTYAGIAPQYTLWILPFLLLANMRLALLYTASATMALFGFYLYAVPDTLPYITGAPHLLAQILYGAGGTAWWLTSALILVWTARKELTRNIESTPLVKRRQDLLTQ